MRSRRPPWFGIFAKAYGLTAQEFPQLRRTFIKWPWPHLYEYPTSVAGVCVERDVDGEPCVMLRLIKDPAALRIGEIADIIRSAAETPIDELSDFKRIVALARLPGVLRRPIMWTWPIGRAITETISSRNCLTTAAFSSAVSICKMRKTSSE